jgi:glucose/mannose transport system substrate-binding protein
MFRAHKLALALALALAAGGAAHAAAPRAEVIHWWTSGGESAAVRKLADAYRAAGGVWIDSAVSGSEQARAVALNRMAGGDPPTAAQFNTSKQFLDVIEEDLLNNVDQLARQQDWDRTLPAPIRDVIRVNGHYYAVPMDIHMPAWFWYSKAAFRKAGIAKEPASMDELFAALDKLRAAGLVPLAHGGQSWQENIVFMAMLANVGGQDLYLKVFRDRDQRAIASPEFRKVLLAFKRLHSYVDAGSPGRNWNDATAMLISGKAGVQIMGDWVKAEFAAARKVPGKDYGCITGFGPHTPALIQGDAFIFPKSGKSDAVRAQQLLASVMTAPALQLEFNRLKGSIPVNANVDPSKLDVCARAALALMKDRSRQVGNGEVYLLPGQNGELADVLTAYWNSAMPVEKVQHDIANLLKN